jgi:hypothetical protein
MVESAQYEILAVRYGVAHSTKAALFHRFHERRRGQAILVDTGFRPQSTAGRPGRECVTPPMEALAGWGSHRRRCRW